MSIAGTGSAATEQPGLGRNVRASSETLGNEWHGGALNRVLLIFQRDKLLEQASTAGLTTKNLAALLGLFPPGSIEQSDAYETQADELMQMGARAENILENVKKGRAPTNWKSFDRFRAVFIQRAHVAVEEARNLLVKNDRQPISCGVRLSEYSAMKSLARGKWNRIVEDGLDGENYFAVKHRDPKDRARFRSHWEEVVRFALEYRYTNGFKQQQLWVLERDWITGHLGRLPTLPSGALYTYTTILAISEGEPNANMFIKKWEQHMQEYQQREQKQ